MKASKFNMFIDLGNDEILAFNSMTFSLVKIDRAAYKRYLRLASGEKFLDSDLDPATAAEAKDFQKGGFLISDALDEIDLLKVNCARSKFSAHNVLSLTIGVTTACNFACSYCYENHIQPEFLSKDVAEGIYSFAGNSIHENGSLAITWYGGEPLLGTDIIYEMSDRLMEIASEKKARYSASIVTNGYLLDRQTAAQLSGKNVRSAQVTVDGFRDVHDTRRMLKNGGGTFDTIIGNILESADLLPISVRVNLDRSNIDSFPELLDEFDRRGISKKISVLSPAMLESFGFQTDEMIGRAFTPEDFSAHYLKVLSMIMDRGIKTEISRPRVRHMFCGAVSQNSYVVDPRGNLYKCWDEIGVEDEAVGKIDRPIRMEEGSLKWLAWDCFGKKECLDCKLLPICFGGCPRMELVKDEIVNQKCHCTPLKYNIPEYVKLLYRQASILKKTG